MFTLLGPTVKKPSKLVRARYRSTLLNSSFTLSPVGTNDECFRFWEAIEAGSIPIFVPRQGYDIAELLYSQRFALAGNTMERTCKVAVSTDVRNS